MSFLKILMLLLAAALAGLALWRGADHLADRRIATKLRSFAPTNPAHFDPAIIADLPEAARRYLTFAIAPGAALTPVAEFEMEGVLRMGDAENPRELAMTAQQVHAPPHGFLWKMRAGAGVMFVSGSDSAEWTRFWAEGLLPVARVSGTPDHRRAALGRLFIEAALWTPAATLANEHVRWEEAGPDTARVIFSHEGHEYAVDLALLPSGQPVTAQMMRWSDANPDKQFRLQPFGGEMLAFETHDGFTIPTAMRVGNLFGTPDYFPFFEARVTKVRFLKK